MTLSSKAMEDFYKATRPRDARPSEIVALGGRRLDPEIVALNAKLDELTRPSAYAKRRRAGEITFEDILADVRREKQEKDRIAELVEFNDRRARAMREISWEDEAAADARRQAAYEEKVRARDEECAAERAEEEEREESFRLAAIQRHAENQTGRLRWLTP